MYQKRADLWPAISQLVPACGEQILITIDGPAGSGKTTLANEIENQLSSALTIHMDDLYEGWSSTLTPKLTAKLLQILSKVRDESIVSFEPFNWITNSLQDELTQLAPKFLILEGVGAGQSAIRELTSLAIWIEVPADLGLARVISRDGRQVEAHMPGFNSVASIYFEKEGVKSNADFHLSGRGTV